MKTFFFIGLFLINFTANAVDTQVVQQILSQEACACRCGNSTLQCLEVHTSCEVSKNRLNNVLMSLQSQENTRTLGANSKSSSICDIYPTRCQPYSGPQRVGPLGLQGYPGASPIYTPGQLVPSYGAVTRSGLNAIPPHMREQLYPDSVRDAVRSGSVDQAIENSMRRTVDPYLEAINGTGPGGAYYTNEAAKAILNGTTDPATAACQAMGGCR